MTAGLAPSPSDGLGAGFGRGGAGILTMMPAPLYLDPVHLLLDLGRHLACADQEVAGYIDINPDGQPSDRATPATHAKMLPQPTVVIAEWPAQQIARKHLLFGQAPGHALGVFKKELPPVDARRHNGA